MRLRTPFFVFMFAAVFCAPSRAGSGVLSITLKEAEQLTLGASNQLKSLSSNVMAAGEQADAQYSLLFPRLTLNANYTYIATVPTISLPIPGFNGGLQFGSHNNYNLGPALSYTLWDTGATRDAYHGLDLLTQSRDQDRKYSELQLLLSVRSSYLRLQLALEELRLLGNSLELSRAQNRDIEVNFRAGAATQLDRVDSQRDVINYQLQFEQKQAEVGNSLKDLLALTQTPPPVNSDRPGPPGVANVGLELRLDSLDQSLAEANRWSFLPPGELYPAVRSQGLLAESSERLAESQKSTLYPTLQLAASAVIEYPNQIILENTEQATVAVSLSMPLFESNRTRHQVAQKRMEADAAHFNQEQTRINLERDYAKALQLLESLRRQDELSGVDVQRSADAARLYYRSYKGGKNNLIDVQAANNRALLAQVNAARINAQTLNQLFILKSLSGEASNHDGK